MADVDAEGGEGALKGQDRNALTSTIELSSPVLVEDAAPMLEVHLPHSAPHTWKDFFVHIAIITIGLLIAIGLEQTVEYIHHRSQVREMVIRLREESLQNHDTLADDIGQVDRVMHALQSNLDILDGVPAGFDKTPFVPVALPNWVGYLPSDTAWLMMRDSALLPLVPNLVVQNYWKIEVTLAALDRRKWIAEESRTQVATLLKLYARSPVLAPPQRQLLQRAFLQYQEELSRYRTTLSEVDILNSLTLANQSISFQSGRKRGFGD